MVQSLGPRTWIRALHTTGGRRNQHPYMRSQRTVPEICWPHLTLCWAKTQAPTLLPTLGQLRAMSPDHMHPRPHPSSSESSQVSWANLSHIPTPQDPLSLQALMSPHPHSQIPRLPGHPAKVLPHRPEAAPQALIALRPTPHTGHTCTPRVLTPSATLPRVVPNCIF